MITILTDQKGQFPVPIITYSDAHDTSWIQGFTSLKKVLLYPKLQASTKSVQHTIWDKARSSWYNQKAFILQGSIMICSHIVHHDHIRECWQSKVVMMQVQSILIWYLGHGSSHWSDVGQSHGPLIRHDFLIALSNVDVICTQNRCICHWTWKDNKKH